MYHSEHAQLPTEISGKILLAANLSLFPELKASGKVPEISLFLSSLVHNVECWVCR